jgi:TPR repeat protein
MARRIAFALFALLLAATGPASADLIEDGLAAIERGDFAAAFEHWANAEKHWRPLAEQGDAEGLYKLGVMHLNGYGVDQDEAEALRLIRTKRKRSG